MGHGLPGPTEALYQVAGLGVLEHDGSYPGDLCAATDHPGHRGLDDSQWVNWKAITDFYKWCRGDGVYLNIPDWYFLNGGSKTAMGYRETNWSLPREYQEIIERQNIFDGTWEKTPSMGWMFVPLTEYHGGGAAATIEPLKDICRTTSNGWRTSSRRRAGVLSRPAAVRRAGNARVVKKWVISTSRIARCWTATSSTCGGPTAGTSIICCTPIPALKEKGLLMVYNPLE